MATSPVRRRPERPHQLFAALRVRLEEVLRRYQIPSDDAGDLLEQVAIELIYKGGELEDPGPWLVARLRGACRRYWVAHRRGVAAAVSRVFATR